MDDRITLDKIEKDLEFYNKMYDAVRIVDPIKKVVLEQRGVSTKETEEICHDYWKYGNICDNCVSVHAYNNGKSFIKLEESPKYIMVVTAIPIDGGSQPLVLELLKNATDSMLVGSGNYNEGEMMRTTISRLNDMVVRDPLTSLYNRRFINDRLPVDVIKSSINDSPLSLIFMDVDNLKNINDTYGHGIGDLTLVEVGKAINNSIRSKDDWAARYGGDEFVVCLNNTDKEEAHSVGNRIIKSIENIAIPTEEGSIKPKLSMGFHTMKDTKITANELIGYADRNMYEVKRNYKD